MRQSSFKLISSLLVLSSISLIDQQSSNGFELPESLIRDTSNDDAIHLTTIELLTRSGFGHEEYFSIADDGYITQLVRVINPLADRSRPLRQPPVLLLHGAHFDTSVYLMASSIQHRPEKYPPSADRPTTGPTEIRSSNRSLGFVLANNGFDVWLVGARGSNKACQAHVNGSREYINHLQASSSCSFTTFERPSESMYDYSRTSEDYWLFSQDEILASNELRHQIDLVQRVTKETEFIYVSQSISSTETTFAFLAQNPDYARRCRHYVQLGPTIGASQPVGAKFAQLFWQHLLPSLPARGVGLTPTFSLEPLLKQLVVELARESATTLRYGLIHHLLGQLYGPVPAGQTRLELNMLARIFKPNSFKQLQHYGQNARRTAASDGGSQKGRGLKWAKFDYGPQGNRLRYNQSTAPPYRFTSFEVQNYTIVSGTRDALVSQESVQRWMAWVGAELRPAAERDFGFRRTKHLEATGYNHLDLVAGVECDKYVNLPLLRVLLESSS